MEKKTKKKGFSLIEMMIVIAVVAVLVAVIIPIVQRETIKARAAANAANLRSIEGQVAMHMVLNQGVYDDFLEGKATLNKASTGVLGKIYNFFFGAGAAEDFVSRYDRLADNGRGEIPVPNGDTIPNVSKAKGLEAPYRDSDATMVVADGQIMSIYITDEGAMAFYGDWNKEDFADVAEDGVYDGTTVSSGSGTGTGTGGLQQRLEEAVCIREGKHSPGPGCRCQTCGGWAHWGADAPTYQTSATSHVCEDNHILDDEHVYVEVDKTYHKCVRCGDAAQNLEHNWGYTKCEDCDAEKATCGATGCYEVVLTGTDYCADHQLKTCGATLNGGGTCTEQIPTGTTCPKVLSHAISGTCPYPGCGASTFQWINNGMCSTHKGYVQCAKGHWYNTSYCETCGIDYNCAFGSSCTNTVKVQGGYCSNHSEKPCPKKVMNLFNTGLTDCDGTYRDSSIGKCGTTHYKAVTKTCSVGSGKYVAGYCSTCGNWHKSGTTKTYTAYEVDNS